MDVLAENPALGVAVAALAVVIVMVLMFGGAGGKVEAGKPDKAQKKTKPSAKARKKGKGAGGSAAAAPAAAPEAEFSPVSAAPLETKSEEPAVAAPSKKKKRVRAKKTASGGSAGPAVIPDPPTPEAAAADAERAREEAFAAATTASTAAADLDDGWSEVVTSDKKRKPKRSKQAAAAAVEPAAAAAAVPGAPATAAATASTAAASTAAEAAPPTKTEDTVTVQVPSGKMGLLIGPKGATRKAIEDATGARVSMPRDEAPAPPSANVKVPVVVTGPDRAVVKKAEKAIKELVKKGYTSVIMGPDFDEGVVQVHPRCVSELIGSKGCVIRSIRDQLNVQINIPQQSPDQPDKLLKVTLAGDKGNVKQAKAVVADIVKYHHHPVTHPGYVHAEVDIPEWQFALFSGTRGANIRHIEADSNAQVFLPRAWSEVRTTLIVGTQAEVKKALLHVTGLLQRLNQPQANGDDHAAADADRDEEEPHEEWMDEYMYKRS